jgi:hypothetical protein
MNPEKKPVALNLNKLNCLNSAKPHGLVVKEDKSHDSF